MMKTTFLILLILALFSCGDGIDEITHAGYCEGYPDWEESKYNLPWEEGEKIEVMQGNCSDLSHWGSQRYAYDFDMSIGTNITAIRSGTVVGVEESFEDGSPCPDNNYLEIEHSDGTIAHYLHLTKDGALVEKGDDVDQDDVIAESGNTGCSTAPHLHLIVFEDDSNSNSVPVNFKNITTHIRGLKEGKSHKAKN